MLFVHILIIDKIQPYESAAAIKRSFRFIKS